MWIKKGLEDLGIFIVNSFNIVGTKMALFHNLEGYVIGINIFFWVLHRRNTFLNLICSG